MYTQLTKIYKQENNMKNKGVILNLAIICLCACMVAIGVYAAKSSSLDLTGQLSFEAHNCMVQVTGQKKGYATNEDMTEYAMGFNPIEFAQGVTTAIVGGPSGLSTGDLGELKFTDLASNTIPKIVIELTLTNQSSYPVSAIITVVQ